MHELRVLRCHGCGDAGCAIFTAAASALTSLTALETSFVPPASSQQQNVVESASGMPRLVHLAIDLPGSEASMREDNEAPPKRWEHANALADAIVAGMANFARLKELRLPAHVQDQLFCRTQKSDGVAGNHSAFRALQRLRLLST